MTQATMRTSSQASPVGWDPPQTVLHRDEQGVSGSPGSAASVLQGLRDRHRQSHRLPPMQGWTIPVSSAVNLMVEIVEHVYSLVEVRTFGFEAEYGLGLVAAQTVFLLDADGSRLPPMETLTTLKDLLPAGCVAELGWSIPNLVWQSRLAKGMVGELGVEAREYAEYAVELERRLTTPTVVSGEAVRELRGTYLKVRRDFERFALMSPREQRILERSRR